MQKVKISTLIESKFSKDIYSSEPSKDLIESIKQNGIVTPIWIDKNNTIIAGHRRVNACKNLGIEEIEAEEKDYSDMLVIESNRYREKTWNEKLKEAEELEKILKPKAKESQKRKPNSVCKKSDKQNIDTKKEVAEKVGTSHDTLHKAQVIAEAKPELLKDVDDGKKTINSAYNEVVREKQKTSLKKNPITPPKGKFNIILADPPWEYDFVVSPTRAIENQYPTMTVDEICKMSVDNFIDDNAVIFLWATSPKLLEALQVLKAWEFDYKTNAVWVKDKIGMGYYFRQQHEILLIGKKGNIPTPEPSNRISSVINAPRTKHSQKPEEIYSIIEKMYPGYKYLELFSRNKAREIWEVWGNQSE